LFAGHSHCASISPKSDLLPRKIEVEQHYLEEALQLLSLPQSEGFMQLVDALFKRPTTDLVEVMFDTDVAAKANYIGTEQGGRRVPTPSEGLIRAVRDIRAGAIDISTSNIFAMSSSSLIAATTALRRAKDAGNIGGKGILKRSAQRTAGVFAISAAMVAAVQGSIDGIHGADPRVTEAVCRILTSIFESHGAVHLRAPLLRPRPNTHLAFNITSPVEVVNTRGNVLLLPEDLTAPL
jgi:translation initiation factor 2-alpha kinase 4